MSSSAATAKIILAALKVAYKKDRANVYELPKSVKFLFRGVTPEWHGTYFDFTPKMDPVLGQVATFVDLHAYGRRDASGKVINNGATMAPDTIPGAKEGAAVHDPAYLEMTAIAEAWKFKPYEPGLFWGRDWVARRFSKGSTTWTRADVRQMFDDIFGDAMVEARSSDFACLYHDVVRLVGGLFHDLSAIKPSLALVAASCVLVSGCAGCATPRDVVEWIEGLPKPVLVPEASADPSTNAPAEVSEPVPVVVPAASPSDAVPYASLTWRITRDRPTVAAPAATAVIRRGSFSSSKLTFSWADPAAAGKALGSSSHDPAQLRAYVFFGGDGGFFDWCSVTRTERGLNNIKGSWQGWDKVDKSRRPVAFFIGSKDGRTRTNIISFD